MVIKIPEDIAKEIEKLEKIDEENIGGKIGID